MRIKLGIGITNNSSTSNVSNNAPKPNLSQLFKFDFSVFILLISNLITIFFAVTENWGIMNVLWIYWGQSVIIGLFVFFKIIRLKNFSTDKLLINHQPVQATNQTKMFTAFFFAFHYGFFHLAYFFFLKSSGLFSKLLNVPGQINSYFILLAVGIFFANHLISFFYNRKEDSKKVQNLGKIMFSPYARIFPMHIIIIFGAFLIHSTISLIVFMLLKTVADILMHNYEHLEF
jgi:hypothetical protein